MEGNDGKIIDKICDYSERAEIKPLLKEYMKRFVPLLNFRLLSH
jgi:hypothetical protein